MTWPTICPSSNPDGIFRSVATYVASPKSIARTTGMGGSTGWTEVVSCARARGTDARNIDTTAAASGLRICGGECEASYPPLTYRWPVPAASRRLQLLRVGIWLVAVRSPLHLADALADLRLESDILRNLDRSHEAGELLLLVLLQREALALKVVRLRHELCNPRLIGRASLGHLVTKTHANGALLLQQRITLTTDACIDRAQTIDLIVAQVEPLPNDLLAALAKLLLQRLSVRLHTLGRRRTHRAYSTALGASGRGACHARCAQHSSRHEGDCSHAESPALAGSGASSSAAGVTDSGSTVGIA